MSAYLFLFGANVNTVSGRQQIIGYNDSFVEVRKPTSAVVKNLLTNLYPQRLEISVYGADRSAIRVEIVVPSYDDLVLTHAKHQVGLEVLQGPNFFVTGYQDRINILIEVSHNLRYHLITFKLHSLDFDSVRGGLYLFYGIKLYVILAVQYAQGSNTGHIQVGVPDLCRQWLIHVVAPCARPIEVSDDVNHVL